MPGIFKDKLKPIEKESPPAFPQLHKTPVLTKIP